jgi:predicted SAM-dependent methyltransferase
MSDPALDKSRKEKILFDLNMEGLGLEIGPSHNPVVLKKEGYNVQTLDHLSAEGLKQKYAAHGEFGVDLENVEEVDFVWNGEPLPELIGNTQCYDWIIASHVIEHVPDVLGFLQQCDQLLKPEGKLSLVIPDKRFCFDYLSPLTSTGQLLDAFEQKRTRPSVGQVFDHFANACKKDNEIAWAEDVNEFSKIELIHPLHQAISLGWHWINSGEYIDVHCWRFTLESFDMLMSDFKALELLELEVKSSFPTMGHEFYVTLGKVSMEQDNRRSRSEKLKSLLGV